MVGRHPKHGWREADPVSRISQNDIALALVGGMTEGDEMP